MIMLMNMNNNYMQETGIHFMNSANNMKDFKEPENQTNSLPLDESEIADRLLDLDVTLSKSKNSYLQATGYTIIFKPYSKNPYRDIKKSESGLIFGGDVFASMHKSDDTGEMENSEPFICCGKAISCGPECKYVKEGEDFYYRNTRVPVPFNNLGYYAISEQNVICRVINE